jgi:hypothetical protein
MHSPDPNAEDAFDVLFLLTVLFGTFVAGIAVGSGL